jgi:hypothetical protein
MKIDFVKSGGFAGALRNVQGTIQLTDEGAEVTAPGGYHRELAPEESKDIRAATANPAVLTQAAEAIQSRGRGAADMDQYQITVTTDDGKTHAVDLNTAGGPELQAASPGASNLIRWIRQESKNILSHRTAGR